MLKKLLRTLFIKDRNFYIMVFQIAVPIAVQSLIEQNRCAMACQGCGAVSY